MYVVSSVDKSSLLLKNFFYGEIICTTCVYRTKAEFYRNKDSFIGIEFKRLEIPVSIFKALDYEDSPLEIPYTTFITGLEADKDYMLAGNMIILQQRVKACHDRFVQHIEYLIDKHDERFSVMQTFENIRKAMQKPKLT